MTIVNRRNAVVGWVDAQGCGRAGAPEGEAGPRSHVSATATANGKKSSIEPLPLLDRRPRPVRAGQAGRGGAARARARARRQARLERGAVSAVPGGARGDGARRARAQPLSRRRRLGAAHRARRAARRRLRGGDRRGRRRRDHRPARAGDARSRRRRSSAAGRPSRATSSTAAKLGAEARRVPLRDHTYDLDGLLAAIGPRTKLVYVCHPNNPTGTANGAGRAASRSSTGSRSTSSASSTRRTSSTSTIPDYADGLELFREGRRIAVLRTFSKIYGLAGLRVGWAVAPADVVDGDEQGAARVRRRGDGAGGGAREPRRRRELARRRALNATGRDRLAEILRESRPRAGRAGARQLPLRRRRRRPGAVRAAAAGRGHRPPARRLRRARGDPRHRRHSGGERVLRGRAWDTSFLASRNPPAAVVRSSGSS